MTVSAGVAIKMPTSVTHPPLCLIIGNEIEGVGQNILTLCDRAIEIDMAGVKNSLNVAVAFGIAAYHFRGCLRAAGKQKGLNNSNRFIGEFSQKGKG